VNRGHSSLHELLAQIRDVVNVQAHGYRMQGKPDPYQRPFAPEQRKRESMSFSNPADASAIKRFFGTPR
jgi:hypothetical protein